MKQLRFIIIALLFVMLCASCYPKESKRVGVLMWSEGLKGYRQAYQGIVDGLRDNGYRDGFNIEIDYRVAEGSEEKARAIVDGFVWKEYDVIVVVGSAASIVALDRTQVNKTPIVYSVVTSPKEGGVIDDWASSGKNITGVSIDIPAEMFFEKLKKILPKARTVGIVYMGAYQTSIASAERAKEAAPTFNLTPYLIELADEDFDRIPEVVAALPAALDAVYIVGDPKLYEESVMKKLNTAFKMLRIPSILISENYLTYGALFALNGDFYKIGRQTVPHILKVFDRVDPRDIPNEKPYDVRFTINKKTADDLGINLKWNVIIEANSIVE